MAVGINLGLCLLILSSSFLQGEPTIRVTEGENAIIPCKIQSISGVKWFINDASKKENLIAVYIPVRESYKYYLHLDDGGKDRAIVDIRTGDLTIKSVRTKPETDEHVYICTARNITRVTHLIILEGLSKEDVMKRAPYENKLTSKQYDTAYNYDKDVLMPTAHLEYTYMTELVEYEVEESGDIFTVAMAAGCSVASVITILILSLLIYWVKSKRSKLRSSSTGQKHTYESIDQLAQLGKTHVSLKDCGYITTDFSRVPTPPFRSQDSNEYLNPSASSQRYAINKSRYKKPDKTVDEYLNVKPSKTSLANCVQIEDNGCDVDDVVALPISLRCANDSSSSSVGSAVSQCHAEES